jgi:hypothetical protein
MTHAPTPFNFGDVKTACLTDGNESFVFNGRDSRKNIYVCILVGCKVGARWQAGTRRLCRASATVPPADEARQPGSKQAPSGTAIWPDLVALLHLPQSAPAHLHPAASVCAHARARRIPEERSCRERRVETSGIQPRFCGAVMGGVKGLSGMMLVGCGGRGRGQLAGLSRQLVGLRRRASRRGVGAVAIVGLVVVVGRRTCRISPRLSLCVFLLQLWVCRLA